MLCILLLFLPVLYFFLLKQREDFEDPEDEEDEEDIKPDEILHRIR